MPLPKTSMTLGGSRTMGGSLPQDAYPNGGSTHVAAHLPLARDERPLQDLQNGATKVCSVSVSF